MKNKIATALKTKYANLGLSEKAFNGVASLLEKTITDEATIETAIAEQYVATFLKGYQSDLDTLRGEKSTALKALEDYKKAHPETIPTNEDETLKAIKALQERLDKSDLERKEAETKAQRSKMLVDVRNKMKESGSDNDFILDLALNNVEFGDSDTVDTIATKYKGVYDETFKKAYGNGAIPPRSNTGGSGEYKQGDYKSQTEFLKKSGLLPQDKN